MILFHCDLLSERSTKSSDDFSAELWHSIRLDWRVVKPDDLFDYVDNRCVFASPKVPECPSFCTRSHNLGL